MIYTREINFPRGREYFSPASRNPKCQLILLLILSLYLVYDFNISLIVAGTKGHRRVIKDQNERKSDVFRNENIT